MPGKSDKILEHNTTGPVHNPFDLVYVLRNGMPGRSCGGPRRIIAELLTQLHSSDEVHSLQYLTASLFERYSHNNAFLDQGNADTGKWKESIARLRDRTKIGLYAQLVRDRYRFPRQLKKTCSERNIFHSHDVIASGLLFPSVSSPKITTHHGKGSLLSDFFLQEYPFIAGTFVERAFRSLEIEGIRSSDVLTFPSIAAKELFDQDYGDLLSGKRVEIIYNGIPLEPYQARMVRQESVSTSQPFRLINVSAMVQEKRFDLVIEVVKELRRRKRNVFLSHIGEGYLLKEYKKRVAEEGLSDAIVFLGKKENHEVVDALYSADVFFMPSERVVFDLITLEAMAAGLPCILSEEGGNIELVTNNVTGCLCRSGDVQAYVERIETLMDDERKRREIGTHARNLVFERYGSVAMAISYLNLYRSVAESMIAS
jgi:glycosyltransferase involved in cell wall biosynthesis